MAQQWELVWTQSEDLADLVALDQLCLGGMWSLEGYQREWQSPNTVLLSLKSLASESCPAQLIGSGAFWQILEEAHITLLMVHPEYQGRGLGTWLLGSLLEEAVARGLERATLEVRVSNERAIALYQKFGFLVAGRRKKYYPDTNEDALILWRKDLAQNLVSALSLERGH